MDNKRLVILGRRAGKTKFDIEFINWLEKIKWLLPPGMSIAECKLLFERKLREENNE